MRLLIVGGFTLWVAAVAAQAPPTPADHPAAPTVDRRDASTLTERLRPSISSASVAAVPRKNLVDEFIFGKMEADRIPHAGLASDEEFFRRVHIDLTGRIATDEDLRTFLTSPEADKRDKLIDKLVVSRACEDEVDVLPRTTSTSRTPTVSARRGRSRSRSGSTTTSISTGPYNEMVQDMLTANAVSNWYVGPASYVARWVITAVACDDEVHEDTSEELAIHAAKDFLGVDTSCVSCHNGARHLEKINLYLSERQAQSALGDGRFLRQDARAPPHGDHDGSGRVLHR